MTLYLLVTLHSRRFPLYFYVCPFYSSFFLRPAHCQSGSVRFLGVVLSSTHTHSQQPQCCSRLVHVISNPLQLEQASVGMKQGRQMVGLPRKSNPFLPLTQHKKLGTSGLECKQNTPCHTQTTTSPTYWMVKDSTYLAQWDPQWVYFFSCWQELSTVHFRLISLIVLIFSRMWKKSHAVLGKE